MVRVTGVEAEEEPESKFYQHTLRTLKSPHTLDARSQCRSALAIIKESGSK